MTLSSLFLRFLLLPGEGAGADGFVLEQYMNKMKWRQPGEMTQPMRAGSVKPLTGSLEFLLPCWSYHVRA